MGGAAALIGTQGVQGGGASGEARAEAHSRGLMSSAGGGLGRGLGRGWPAGEATSLLLRLGPLEPRSVRPGFWLGSPGLPGSAQARLLHAALLALLQLGFTSHACAWRALLGAEQARGSAAATHGAEAPRHGHGVSTALAQRTRRTQNKQQRWKPGWRLS